MITFLAYVALVVIVAQVGYKAVTRIARGGRGNELIAHRYAVKHDGSSYMPYYPAIQYTTDGGSRWQPVACRKTYSFRWAASARARAVIRGHRRALLKAGEDGWITVLSNGRVSSGV